MQPTTSSTDLKRMAMIQTALMARAAVVVGSKVEATALAEVVAGREERRER